MSARSKTFPLLLCLGLLLALGLLLTQARPATTAGPLACVAGPHSGTILASEEWCLADSPHLLSGDVIVGSGAVLTLEPGVVVQGSAQGLDDGTELRVNGTLLASGTPTQPITFTSVADSGPGEWAGLVFDGGSGSLIYTTVRYAGLGSHAGIAVLSSPDLVAIQNSSVLSSSAPVADYGLYIDNSQVRVTNSRVAGNGDSIADYGVWATGAGTGITLTQVAVENNAGSGVGLAGGANGLISRPAISSNGLRGIEASGTGTRLATRGGTVNFHEGDGLYIPSGVADLNIRGTRFVNNLGDGIDYGGSGLTEIRYSSIYGNGGFGLLNQNPAVCFDAAYVYWGDLGGPNDASAVDDGCMGPVANASPTGEEVGDDVDYAPWVGLAPTATLAGPDMGARLIYTDGQGLVTIVDIPAGVTGESIIFVYTAHSQPAQPPPHGLGWSNHGLDLSTYGSGSGLPGYQFLLPVTVTIEYSEADLAGRDEATLRLYYLDNGVWQDAATTCDPPSDYVRNPAENWIQLPVCRPGQYDLLIQEQVHLYYLPFVVKGF